MTAFKPRWEKAGPELQPGNFVKRPDDEKVSLAELIGLSVILLVFVVLSLTVAVATPPWESNDEPDHFRNAATLARGTFYKLEPGAGFEAHQPPIYYLILATAIRAWDLSIDDPVLLPADDDADTWVYKHVPEDTSDMARVAPLRMLSVVMGAVTIVCVFLLAVLLFEVPGQRLATAATVGFLPKFVFLSGSINNDTLATMLSSLAIVLMAAALFKIHRRSPTLCMLTGLILGLGVVTKLTVLPLAVVLVALGVYYSNARLPTTAMLTLPLIGVSGWWVVRNVREYGDPLLIFTAEEHFKEVLPALVHQGLPLRWIAWELPTGFMRSFWYSSGANQFEWEWPFYLPFWLVTATALVGLAIRLTSEPTRRKIHLFLVFTASAGLVNVIATGIRTTQFQGRIAFVSLTAIASLIILGLIKFPQSRVSIWLLPAFGFVGSVISIYRHVLVLT